MEKATIRSIIEDAVQKEGLERSYTQQLIELFEGKGIDLKSDGKAYEQAVRDTCKLQAAMKATEFRTLEAKKKLDTAIGEIAHSWEELVKQVYRLQDLVSNSHQSRLAQKRFKELHWPSQVLH